ncbi:hypothetical protein [Nocardioides halotolerans]|uniref:hypothetical protein n=1 Tax=Nocardioides halotolerans TaxID=433660 RepID=UPI00040F9FAC|nr:hypothetical protein [Nocardioides halotolerans]
MTASESLPAQTAKILGLTALVDLLAGLVLAVIGLVQDQQTLAIVGVVLLLSGGGLLAWVTMMRNKPEVM